MYLFELFDSGMSIKTTLQQAVIDILTPLTANKVPYVTIDAIVQELNQHRTGILIDKALVTSILDPNVIKNITKIEGDKVYLQVPDEEVENSKDTQEDQIDKVKKQAMSKAQADVKQAQ